MECHVGRIAGYFEYRPWHMNPTHFLFTILIHIQSVHLKIHVAEEWFPWTMAHKSGGPHGTVLSSLQGAHIEQGFVLLCGPCGQPAGVWVSQDSDDWASGQCNAWNDCWHGSVVCSHPTWDNAPETYVNDSDGGCKPVDCKWLLALQLLDSLGCIWIGETWCRVVEESRVQSQHETKNWIEIERKEFCRRVGVLRIQNSCNYQFPSQYMWLLCSPRLLNLLSSSRVAKLNNVTQSRVLHCMSKSLPHTMTSTPSYLHHWRHLLQHERCEQVGQGFFKWRWKITNHVDSVHAVLFAECLGLSFL